MKETGSRTFSAGALSENVRDPILILLVAAALTAGCGKKGPPLPPLIKLPAPPADFTAQRRGSKVDLQFTVPSANIDGTRPANVERVEVYGFTGPPTVTDDQLLKRGTKVASVPTKTPGDPNETIEPDEPQDELQPPEGPGLDQGAAARLEEELTSALMVPADLTKDLAKPSAATVDTDQSRPLLGPPPAATSRTYVSVSVGKRGRKGPVSKRASVPLVPPPARPRPPSVSYDEKTITVTWTAAGSGPLAHEPASGSAGGSAGEPTGKNVLPARPIGPVRPAIAYNVYEVSPMAAASPLAVASGSSQASASVVASGSSRTAQAPQTETRLTKTPIADTHFSDTRIEWGAERCYVVRAVESVGGLTLESDAAPPVCEKLVDTFPPAAPKGLTAVATEGVISLIWQSNDEKDLDGYIVFRAVAPGESLSPVTSSPIQETTYRDAVQPAVPYVYAVAAVDKAGNMSAPSNRVEETAR